MLDGALTSPVERKSPSMRKLLGKWTGVTFAKRALRAFRNEFLSDDYSRDACEHTAEDADISTPQGEPSAPSIPCALAPFCTDCDELARILCEFLSASAERFESDSESSDSDSKILSLRGASESASSVPTAAIAARASLKSSARLDPVMRAVGAATAAAYAIDYSRGGRLGRGAFSTVRAAVHRSSGVPLAIKIIPGSVLRTDPRLSLSAAREVAVMRGLPPHPNIISLHEATILGDSLALVMERVQGIELYEYVASRGRLSESVARPLLAQIAAALAFLHRHAVSHRDVKLENVMVQNDGVAKIIDFGLASGPSCRRYIAMGIDLSRINWMNDTLEAHPATSSFTGSLGSELAPISIDTNPCNLEKNHRLKGLDIVSDSVNSTAEVFDQVGINQPIYQSITNSNNKFVDPITTDGKYLQNVDSQMIRSRNEIHLIHASKLPPYLLQTRCGSEEYAAPEVLLGGSYLGPPADAWSFGVLIYGVLCGTLPFNPDDKNPRLLSESILSASFLSPESRGLSPSASSLIRSLLVRDPAARLDMNAVLEHSFFAGTSHVDSELCRNDGFIQDRATSLPAYLSPSSSNYTWQTDSIPVAQDAT